jgi:predicted transcriptional regulator/fibronectin type 3 domain-containing protein
VTGGKPVLGYKVFRGDSADNLTILETLGPLETSFKDTNLTNGHEYWYAVLAFNEVGDGDLGRIANVTPYGPPGVPDSPTAIVGDSHVIIHWGRPTEDGGDPDIMYIIYSLDIYGDEIDAFTTFNTTYTLGGLENGESYRFKMHAVNKGGFSPYTAVITAVPMTIPQAPRSLELEVGPGLIELTWNPPLDNGGTPIDRYIIYRGTGGPSNTSIDEVQHPLTSYTDTDVLPGETFYYSVTAVTAAGEGPGTVVISVISGRLPGPPLALEASVVPESVTLSWDPPEFDGGRPVQGYIVLRGSNEATLEEVASPGLVNRYSDEDVLKGETYVYAVLAFNELGNGPRSEIVRVMMLFLPGAPISVKVSPIENRADLSWQPPEDDGGSPITGYVVLRGTSPEDLHPVSHLGAVLSMTDRGLERGATYYYCVIAVNGMGQSEMSHVVTAEIEGSTSSSILDMSLLIWVTVLLLVFALAGAMSTESFKYRWGLAVAPLFSRLKKDDVLDNKTRYAMHGVIVEKPGIHFSEMIREFNLSNGITAYHLEVLEREDFIRSVRDGRLKRFYSKHTKVPKDHKRTPLEVREAVLNLVKFKPGISQKEIVDTLGITRDSAGYFLREMVREGELEGSRKGKYTIYHPRR